MRETIYPPDDTVEAHYERSCTIPAALPQFRPPQIVRDLDVSLEPETRNPDQVCHSDDDNRCQDEELEKNKRVLKPETRGHETTVGDG